MFKTPLLVNVEGDFPSYLKSLSKGARKNYTAMMKRNPDTSFNAYFYDPFIMERFMKLWEEQLIRGEKRKWGFGRDYLDRLAKEGKIHCYVAFLDGEIVAAQFVEQHGRYVECHPPMYDKKRFSKQYMAKYMWFSLIAYAMRKDGMHWLDLGGGHRGTWAELIANRNNHPNTKYKWMYVPKAVKDNPQDQPDFKVSEDKVLYE